MLDAFIYDFGYPWPFAYGHLIAAACLALVAFAAWRYHHVKTTIAASALAAWALAGSYVVHHVVRLNRPVSLPTEHFLTSGSGRVLDLGAGSGRSAIMVLKSRPNASLTALDIYSGRYYGIVENTPDRLMANARIAGVADRVDVKVGDMRRIPLPDASYDAIVSVAAIDHLRANDVKTTLGEAVRVLKPGGELLLVNVNVDGWIRTAFPWMHGHGYFGRPQDAGRWRSMIEGAGFKMVEQGTQPATLYFLAQKGS